MGIMPGKYLLWLAFAPVCLAEIHYKVPVAQVDTALAPRALSARAVSGPVLNGSGHFVVEFDQPPTPQKLAELVERGVTVLQDVPDNAVLVYVGITSVDLGGLGIISAGPLPAGAKVSVLTLDFGDYIVIEFHPDVSMNTARGIVLQMGLELHENPDIGPHRLLARQWMRSRASDPVRRLSGLDEVAYVFPASQELINGIAVTPCLGAVTQNGEVGQYIATVGEGWDGAGKGSVALKYVWGTGPKTLASSQAWPEIQRAMAEWSKVVAVTWAQATDTKGAKTVSVVFGSGNHGDAYPFDGPNGVLAHTFYPPPASAEPTAGDMHLDNDETWRVGADKDVFSVALHELGHALGLAHSDNPNAVMYPYYRRATGLSQEDKSAILTLYAAAAVVPATPVIPTEPTTPTTPTTPTEPATPTIPDTPLTPEQPTVPTTPTVPPPSVPDKTGPSLTITNPSTSTVTVTAASRQIAGVASDPSGVQTVTWENSLSGSGTATGTNNWAATIPLWVGVNRITIRATDKAGNETWRTLVITRK